MTETMGFIGLGNMGEPIAANLIAAGHALHVYNRTASKATPLVAKGATLAKAPADVASPGGIVFTMVADDRAIDELCLWPGSFVEKLGPGGIHISLSTIAPATARRLAEHHAKHDVEYVASPVFGRPEAAAAKRLWVCTSGPAAAKARVRPLFEAIGQGIFDFGEDSGAANVVKLCGNFLVASTVEALAEMLVAGGKKRTQQESCGRNDRQDFSPVHAGYGQSDRRRKVRARGLPSRARAEGHQSHPADGRGKHDAPAARELACTTTGSRPWLRAAAISTGPPSRLASPKTPG